MPAVKRSQVSVTQVDEPANYDPDQSGRLATSRPSLDLDLVLCLDFTYKFEFKAAEVSTMVTDNASSRDHCGQTKTDLRFPTAGVHLLHTAYSSTM
ncbi:hypothetical protein RRG08_064292 [Elysia crispata]|uniref:Uncharacterized protein n=1 Tax=Elysia crispata TaxID=231223 RepID=A0AAE0YSX5_9GAST|nr:hypothetical protein RRG08_064292 [Elysia crispata]